MHRLPPGLSETDEPEIRGKDLAGHITLWIDIGQPDDARLRKARGRAAQVIALCHSSSGELLWKQIEPKSTRLTNLTVL